MKLISSKTLFILPIALSVIQFAYAQSGDQAEQDTPPAQQDAEAESVNIPKPPVAKPPTKTFKPSEEISEDSPVPFPVDI